MIERIYVHNFRCLENFTLNLTETPSALIIGKNGAGKSTLLSCLEIFQGICRGCNRVSSFISSSDFTQSRTNHPMRFEVDVILSGRRFTYAISFEWPAGFREARILEENLVADGVVIFKRHQAQISLSNGISFNIDWHIFALPVINERPGEQAIQDLKSFFAAMILIAPIPANMSGFSEEPSNELLHDAANYASCLRSLLGQKPAAYSAFEKYVRTKITDFSSIEIVERGESGFQLVVNFEQSDSSRILSVDFKGLSDGEKCFFLSAYISVLNEFVSPVFCVWDEPDNHLSLSQVGQFITSLRKMTNYHGQFIATTHHPETIRAFSDETTYVFVRQSHLDPTKVRLLAEFDLVGDVVNALIRDEIIG